MARKPKQAAEPAVEQASADATPVPPPTVADTVGKLLHDGVVAQAQPDSAHDPKEGEETGEMVDDNHDMHGTPEHAQAFLIGNLMEAAKSCFTTLPEVWSKTSQREQEAVLKRLHDRVLEAAKGAIKVLRDNARMSFQVKLGKVVFNGRKVTGDFELSNSLQAHSLADCSDGYVVIVIEKTDKLLSVPAKLLEGEKDNHELFKE